MSFPTGLFVDAPEMPDVSMHQLEQNSEVWPEQVVQKLKERVPQSNNLSTIVKFMKKDDENGAATGSIVISNAEKQAIVPVIIKDFMLYPMDVFICNKKLLPLTPEYFDTCFNNNQVFQQIEEYPTFGGLGRFEDSNLWNATYPPSLGRYAYASAGYDILDSISDTIDATEFKNYLKENPGVAANFYKHGHTEVIKKLANLRPVNMNEFRQSADNLVRRDIVMLRKEGPNKYTILSNADRVFSPAMIKGMCREEACKFVSKISDSAQDDVNDVDQNGEKLLRVPKVESDQEVYIEEGQKSMAEPANEFDHYVVRKKNGVEVEGVVIPKVINFDMGVVNLKMFLGKTLSTVQPEIAGVRVQNSHFNIPFSMPKVGQTGTFVHMPDKSHALATVPVTIKMIVEEMGTCTMRALDMQGVEIKITMTSIDLNRIAGNREVGYLLPKNKFRWVAMEGFDEVTNSPVDYAVKTAGFKKTANPVKLIYTGHGQYSMKGVDKYAEAMNWDKTNLEEYQAKFLLASLGLSQEKIAACMCKAKSCTQCTMHNLKTPPLKDEKIAAALPLARQMAKIAKDLRVNLIKEASFVENTQTVDALLSLNFVNPENVSKMVEKLPSLKSAISNLASLLVASRLGIQEIPEQSVSAAMMKLVDVVNGLEALRATQGQ